MRSFLIICTLSFVLAIPQYDYSISQSEQTVELHQSGELGSFAPQTSQNLAGPQSPFGPNNLPGPSEYNGQNNYQQNNYQSASHNHANGLSSSFTGQFSGNSVQQGTIHQPQQNSVITKEIYIHAAPEETPEEIAEQQQNVLTPRKHYRVIFIKTPSGSIKSAALRLAQPQNEEKTIIYVLSKKEDGIGPLLSAGAEALPPSKPEVYFIKYKTPEEARHAQDQIRAEYDALGGTTHVTDEGIAPVQSFIGSLGTARKDNHQNNLIQPGIGSLGIGTSGNLGHNSAKLNIGSVNTGNGNNNQQSSFKTVSGSVDASSRANIHQTPINSFASSVTTGGYQQTVPVKSISTFLGTSIDTNFHQTPVKGITGSVNTASGVSSFPTFVNSASGFQNIANQGYQYQSSGINTFQNSAKGGNLLPASLNSITGNQNSAIGNHRQETSAKSFLGLKNSVNGGNIQQTSFNSNFGPTNSGVGNYQQQTPSKPISSGFIDNSPGSNLHQSSLNTIIGGHLNLNPLNSLPISTNTATGNTQNFRNGGSFNQASINPVLGLTNTGNGGYQNQIPANSVTEVLDTATGTNFRTDAGKSDSNSLNPPLKVDSEYIDQLINLVFGNQSNANNTLSDKGESVDGSNDTDSEDDRVHAIDIRSATHSYM